MNKLNINGSEILTYNLDVVTRSHNNHDYEDLIVEIITREEGKEHSYKYRMHSDERVPSVHWLLSELKEMLEEANRNKSFFEISEDSVRRYLFVSVTSNDHKTLQVTGERLR
ncbi:hypothetical protein [Psychrobacter sp. ANT_WB68]|uniref:hypothetical protein n=1 Tax=Psychrobacter sp. ANT_WB68 TaxID=2597355 RepID=UPI0011F32248|nr:hypothetical protein [Psychrobacter sp. ANT_WB68]KAA0915798.1 hypothetical protein FQ084_04495 [Psychrobacter sp. ANT_WB68]